MNGSDSELVHIVDRDAAEMNQWAEWLRPLRIPVRTYRSTDEFTAEYTQVAPACLLVELATPVPAALQLLDWLRARNSPMAMILIGESISIAEAVQAMKSGVFTLAEKPLARDELQTIVGEAVKQSRADWAAVFAWTNSLDALSEREREVVELLLSGKSTKQISKTLQISTSTVHKHRVRVFSKLRVDSSTDLVLRSAHFLTRPSVKK